jgi:hypothetical protein
MYARNTITRRRPSGWVERRRYFRRLFELMRVQALNNERSQKVILVAEKN